MIAVLINSGDVRLGHVQVSEACSLIKFGGAHFVRTPDEAVMPDGGRGVVFAGAEVHVYDKLDHFEPTRNFGGKMREPT